jgi:hypothetical protein
MLLAITLISAGVYEPVPVAVAAESTTSNNTGDEHDDRPDDAGDRPDDADSIGGDQATATTSISDEARAWANTGSFNLAVFEDYTVPAAHEPTDADITAFENWMEGGSNPRNQVMKQIQSEAGDAIANELWNYCNTIWKGWMNTANVGSVVSKLSGLKNVGATQEGMFAGYFGSALGDSNSQDGYDYVATLVKDGFIVSSDDVTYRLHNMIDGSVAYEMTAPESATISEEEFPEGLTDFANFFPLETQKATTEAKKLLAEYAVSEPVNEPSNVDREVYQAASQYVNDKFGEYFGQCPGPTAVKGITALGIELDSVTEDTVGSSVGEKEFVASYFGVESAAASLWRLGFLPSFDGTTYRLHSGKDGTIVYSATLQELQEASSPANLWLYVGLGILIVSLIGGLAFFLKNKRRKKR